MADRALVRKMVRYMDWADDVMLRNAALLPAGAFIADRDTLFGSISGTFDHVLVVAEIFQAHLEGRDHPHTTRRRSGTRSFETVAGALRAINRFAMETKRQLDVLDRRLAESRFLGGDDYSIADIATWPWYGNLARGAQYEDAGTFLQVQSYENVQRWMKEIWDRPAVQRGRKVNKLSGEPWEQLHERHDASDFDTKTQDKLQAAE